MDLAAVGLHDAPGDREPQAHAAEVLRPRHLVEGLEDPLAVWWVMVEILLTIPGWPAGS
jgi:hypothetical protein